MQRHIHPIEGEKAHLLQLPLYITRFLSIKEAVSRILFVTGPSLSSLNEI